MHVARYAFPKLARKIKIVFIVVVDRPNGRAKCKRTLDEDVCVERFQGGSRSPEPGAHILVPALRQFVSAMGKIYLRKKCFEVLVCFSRVHIRNHLNWFFLATGTKAHSRDELVVVASVVNLVSMRVLCRQQSAELDSYRRRYGDKEMNDVGGARFELTESGLNRLSETVEYAPISHQPIVRRRRREPSNPCACQRFGNVFVTQMRRQIDDERKWPVARWRR